MNKRWKAVILYGYYKQKEVVTFLFDEFEELGYHLEGGPDFRNVVRIEIFQNIERERVTYNPTSTGEIEKALGLSPDEWER